MSLFKKLFGSSSEPVAQNPSSDGFKAEANQSLATLAFGRYTDCNKDANQLRHWDQANQAFKERRYVDSFEQFLGYIRDEKINNVTIDRQGDSVSFELIQGSQRIKGKGDSNQFYAVASIVEMPTPSIPVMRKLMNINYGLSYSKFGLSGTTLSMKFSSHVMNASPSKLYAGLSELAKKADQQDDLLLSEFSSLKELDAMHLPPLPTKNQDVKFDFLIQWMRATRDEINRHDREKMAGAIAFLLLDLTYRIDYLICPQGVLTDELEKIQQIFFEKTNATTVDRNARIIEAYDRLLQLPKEKLMEGLYDVKATFAIAKATAHKTVMDMMFKEREKVAWYRDNGYPQVVEAIYGYMISYAYFNYGMVYPVTDILNIGMHVLNPDYYKRMGDGNNFVEANKTLNRNALIAAIQVGVKNANKDYPFLQFNTGALRFDSVPSFLDTLIVELDKIDLRKK